MGTRLLQTVSFANVPAAGTVALPHNININGRQYRPDFVATDVGGFDVAVTDTQVSVTNNNDAPASVDVWLELKHSIPRQTDAVASLTPRPFIVGGGGGGGGASLIVDGSHFATFTATPNTISILTGNQEVGQHAQLPLAADAGNGARCGFKLAAGTAGPFWDVVATGGDSIDIGTWTFPSSNTGNYVEFISDGVNTWYVRIVTEFVG